MTPLVMSDKPTILLAPNDPASPLLAAGRAGAMPPIAFEFASGWWPIPANNEPFADGVLAANEYGYRPKDRALVLALDGEPVPEGCDRAARVLAHNLRPHRLTLGHGVVFHRVNVSDRHDLWGWALECAETDDYQEFVAPTEKPRGGAHVVDSLNEAMTVPLALATICASRLDCRVIVIGGSDAR